MSKPYRVAVVGRSGQKELLEGIHGEVYETDVYRLGKWVVVYSVIDLDASTTYRRERMDAIVFTVDEDTDPRDRFVYEVAALKTAEYDLARVIVFGPDQTARRVATDLRLGHHVSDPALVRDTLLAILRDTRPRDTITLDQSEGGAQRSRGC